MNDALYAGIRSRRVTRNMTDQPIDVSDLDAIVRAAQYAPNAGNRRLQPVVPVFGRRLISLLHCISPGMLPVPRAILVVCIDTVRAQKFGYRPDAPGLCIDVGTTAATLLLAAHAVGLGACPVTSFSQAAAARLLRLPDGVKPRMMICLGHPADTQPAGMGADLNP
jgi:nitroreductase